MIAACFTTPFDVLKTRQQQLQLVPSPPPGGFAEARIGPPKSPAVACSHDGAVVFEARAHSRAPAQPPSAPSTLASLRQIARAEGASALWRGNQARMLKVAPACAIMISSYELGKRILLDDRGR
jgi:solute carrier family 25 protein 39/40